MRVISVDEDNEINHTLPFYPYDEYFEEDDDDDWPD